MWNEVVGWLDDTSLGEMAIKENRTGGWITNGVKEGQDPDWDIFGISDELLAKLEEEEHKAKKAQQDETNK